MQKLKEELKKCQVGNKIKFDSEVQRYTVTACNDRFIIATKPMNALKTYLYTIIDIDNLVRGKDNLVFSIYDYDNSDDASKGLIDLMAGGLEVSYRQRRKLWQDMPIKIFN